LGPAPHHLFCSPHIDLSTTLLHISTPALFTSPSPRSSLVINSTRLPPATLQRPLNFCIRFDISLSLHIRSLAPHWLVSSLARSATPIHTTHPSAAHELSSDLVAQQRRSTLHYGRSRFSPAPTSVSRTGPPEHHLLDQHLTFRTESGPPQTPVGGSRRSRFR
jgi:hypothetical protein